MGFAVKAGSGRPGPVVPPVLPDLGVAGVEHRWHALYATTAADGTTVTAWPDAVAVSPLNLTRSVNESGSPEPLLGTDAGKAHVTIAGIDLSAATQLAPSHSYFLVFKTSVLGKPVFRAVGAEVSRLSTGGSPGRVKVQFGTTPVVAGPTASNSNGWHTVIVAANPAGGSACMIDGVYSTPSGGTYTAFGSGGPNAPTHLMGDGAGGGTNSCSIRDHGSYSGLLSNDQMTALYNALKVAYPDVV